MTRPLLSPRASQTLRKVFHFVHLWVGIIFGLYFVVMGITGSLLVFKDEIDDVTNRALSHVSVPSGGQRKSLDTLVGAVKTAYPGVRIGNITLPTSPGQALVVGYTRSSGGGRQAPGNSPDAPRGGGFGNRREAFVDPYTGAVLGNRVSGGTFFPFVLRLHRALLLNRLGETLNRYGVLLILALLVSGLWLWWPAIRNFKTQFKLRTTIKRGAVYKRVLLDIHNMVGFYGFAVLLVIALTGASYFWKKPTVAIVSAVTGTPMVAQEGGRDGEGPRGGGRGNRGGRGGDGQGSGGGQGFGGAPNAGPAQPLSYDLVVANAQKTIPNMAVLQISQGGGRGGGLRVTKGYLGDYGVRPRVATLMIDARSGEVQSLQKASDLPLGMQVMNWLMPIHYGQWGFGPIYYVVKTIHCLGGLTPLVLFVTGALMYVEKRKGKLQNKRRRGARETNAPEFVPNVESDELVSVQTK